MPFKTCITFLRHQLRFYCDTNRQANKIWAVGPKTLTIQRVSAFFLFIFITMFSFYVCRCNIKNRVHQMRAISGNVRNKSHYRSRFAEQSVSLSKNSKKMVGKISAQPHTTLCIQFLDRENNDKNNRLPLGKQICFTIVWGCAEILPNGGSINIHSPIDYF